MWVDQIRPTGTGTLLSYRNLFQTISCSRPGEEIFQLEQQGEGFHTPLYR